MTNQTARTGNYRWRILSLFFLATTINYIDRQIIAILKPFIAEDLGWSEADYGFIITGFQVAYAAGMLLTGWFLDKFGTKVGYLWSVVIWSLAAMGHALARSLYSFISARFFLGLGESANFPASVKGVAEWFPKKERAFATGLFNSGSTVGAILAPIIVSAITVTLGWRSAFVITGSFGVIWIICWILFYKHPSQHPRLTKEELDFINQDTREIKAEKAVGWKDLFKYTQTIVICTTRFISDWVWWFILFWVPDFLTKTQGVDIKGLVMPLIIIYAIASVGGIGGGWLSSKFIKMGKSVDYARKTTILFSALLVLPVILVSYTHDLWLAVMLIALAAAGHQSWASNIFTIVPDIYPGNAVGSMMGLCGFAGAIGGAMSASFIGMILQATNSYTLVFTVAAVVYLINWGILKLFIPKIEPIRNRI